VTVWDPPAMDVPDVPESAPASHRAPTRRPPIPSGIAISMVSIVSLGVIGLFLALYAVGFSALQEQRSQHQLYAEFRGMLDPTSAVAPATGGSITPGTPIAILDAPGAGIHRAVVVEGTSATDLLKGPGHLRDTPLPGQVGHVVLIGKNLTAGGPFRHITGLGIGGTFTVTTGQGTFRYRVIDVRRKGDPIHAVPADSSELTMITATGKGLAGQVAPNEIVNVDALLQGTPATATAPHPDAVPESELPGHNDPGAWPFVLLWMQALVVVGIGTAVAGWYWSRPSEDELDDDGEPATRRFGVWRAWLLGAPLIFGVLWGLATEATRLLPNIL
jgi:sortase A